jgi:hypothetical protein
VSGKKQPHWSAGVVCGFFANRDKAQAAADEINSGKFDGWSDAIVVQAGKATAEAVA